jgi:uncharacterized membrane protein
MQGLIDSVNDVELVSLTGEVLLALDSAEMIGYVFVNALLKGMGGLDVLIMAVLHFGKCVTIVFIVSLLHEC